MFFFKRFSALTYLLGAFALVSIIPILSLSLLQYNFIKNNILSQLEENNFKILEGLADKIKINIENNIKIVKIFLEDLSTYDSREVKLKLENMKKYNSDFEFLIYIKNNSDSYIFDGDFSKITVKELGITKEILELNKSGKEYLFSENIISSRKNVLSVIFKSNKNSLANDYIIVGIKIDETKDDIKSILETREKLSVLDLNTKKYLINRNAVFHNELDKKTLEEMILNRSGFIRTKDNRLLIYSFIKSINFLIWLEHPDSMYEEELKKHGVDLVIILVNSIVFSILMGLWIAYSQHSFVKKFLESIREIAKGNYKNKVEVGLVLIPKEFTLLVEEFNIMSERVEKLDSFKSNLISTVSHEFRTPLTSIKGFASTLLRPDATFEKDTQRKLLKIISQQADRLSRMIEDLLVVPKLEGNILKLNIREINLEQLVEQSTEIFNPERFEITIDENIYILADSDRIEQVFLNIFENARKYCFPRDSKIKVVAYAKDNYAYISISNSAESVPKEKLDSLFEKFVRLDDTLTRTTGGTGLGLFITKSLIELMKGKIWLEADVEFKVNFTLPLAEE